MKATSKHNDNHPLAAQSTCGNCAHLLSMYPHFVCRRQNRWLRLEDTYDVCSEWACSSKRPVFRG